MFWSTITITNYSNIGGSECYTIFTKYSDCEWNIIPDKQNDSQHTIVKVWENKERRILRNELANNARVPIQLLQNDTIEYRGDGSE